MESLINNGAGATGHHPLQKSKELLYHIFYEN
jgi:hypothetical protein